MDYTVDYLPKKKKYIRTEKGIYELKDNMKISFEKLFEDISNEVGSMYGTEEWVCYGKVLHQADTIEELCDLFINNETKTIFYKYNALDRYVINWETNLVYSLKGLAKEFHSIKGGIWTDKGLIYVAKMNDKGELELI